MHSIGCHRRTWRHCLSAFSHTPATTRKISSTLLGHTMWARGSVERPGRRQPLSLPDYVIGFPPPARNLMSLVVYIGNSFLIFKLRKSPSSALYPLLWPRSFSPFQSGITRPSFANLLSWTCSCSRSHCSPCFVFGRKPGTILEIDVECHDCLFFLL